METMITRQQIGNAKYRIILRDEDTMQSRSFSIYNPDPDVTLKAMFEKMKLYFKEMIDARDKHNKNIKDGMNISEDLGSSSLDTKSGPGSSEHYHDETESDEQDEQELEDDDYSEQKNKTHVAKKKLKVGLFRR